MSHPDQNQVRRVADFQSRASYSPGSVYRHQIEHWEYIPIHPFGDEPALLEKLSMRSEECRSVDAWCQLKDDATLLQVCVLGVMEGPPRCWARLTEHRLRWVYLSAVIDSPYVTRALFEALMLKFVSAGFPSDKKFRLRKSDPIIFL